MPLLIICEHLPCRGNRAQECLDALLALSRQRYVAPVNIAAVYVGIGDRDRAFAWLDKAFDDHSQWLSEIRVDPAFDPVRADPRFTNLLRRIFGAASENDSPQTLMPDIDSGARADWPHD